MNVKYKYVLISAILIWAFFVFFQYVNNHAVYIIFFTIFDSVIPFIISLIILNWFSYSLGRTIIYRLCHVSLEPGIDFLICTALGLIILSFGMTFLTFTRLLSKRIVIIYILSLSVFSLKELIISLRRIRLPQISLGSWYEKVVLFLLVIFILTNLIFALTPPFGLDEQQYHLNAPREYIKSGGFTDLWFMGGQIQFPQNIEMIYTLAMILQSDILAKLINFYFGILSLLILIFISRKFLNGSGIIACGIYYCTWLCFYISSRANVDLAQSFYEAITFLCLILYLERIKQAGKTNPRNIPRDTKFLFIISAVFMGFCLGIKYSSLLALNALLMVLLYYHIFILRSRIPVIAKSISIYVVIVFTLFSPWMVKNIIIYQNPIAPFKIRFLTTFVQGFIPQSCESSEMEISDDLRQKIQKRQATLNKGVYPKSSLKEMLLIPYNATVYGDWGKQVFDSLISPLYLIFIPFVIFIRKKPPLILAVFLYVITIYMQWMLLQPITRYLAPVMVFMSLLIVYLIRYFKDEADVRIRFPLHILNSLIIFTIFMMTCVQILYFVTMKPYEYIFGTESRYQFLLRNNPAYIQKVIRYINEHLPENSYIYLLWEKRGYYIERKYDEDTFGSQFAHLILQYEEPEKVAAALKKQGFTHILCDMYMPSTWFGSSYKESKANEETSSMGKSELEFFQKMSEEHLEWLIGSNTISLYRIR